MVFLPNVSIRSQSNLSSPHQIYTTINVQGSVFRTCFKWDDLISDMLLQYEQTYNHDISKLYLRLDGARFDYLFIQLTWTFEELLADVVIQEFPEMFGDLDI